MEEASELNPLLPEEGGREEAEEVAAAAAAAPPLAAPAPAGLNAARRIVTRWRAFVAERKAFPLLDLLQAVPDLFEQEVLKRLDPTARTMLAQVGRPWLAAVLASGLSRLPKEVTVQLRLAEFCTSAERLAWARANGCPWGGSEVSPWGGSEFSVLETLVHSPLRAGTWRQGLTLVHFSAGRDHFLKDTSSACNGFQ